MPGIGDLAWARMPPDVRTRLRRRSRWDWACLAGGSVLLLGAAVLVGLILGAGALAIQLTLTGTTPTPFHTWMVEASPGFLMAMEAMIPLGAGLITVFLGRELWMRHGNIGRVARWEAEATERAQSRPGDGVAARTPSDGPVGGGTPPSARPPPRTGRSAVGRRTWHPPWHD